MQNVFLKSIILSLALSLSSSNLAILNQNNNVINLANTVHKNKPVFYKKASFETGGGAFSQTFFYQVKNGNTYAAPSTGGLMMSTNGANFQRVTSVPISGNAINNLIQLPNGDIYVSSSQGIFMSKDGLHFQHIFQQSVDHMYPTRQGHIYATSDATTAATGLYLSTNGFTFTQISKIPLWNLFLEAKNGDIYMQSNGLMMSVDGVHFKSISKYGVNAIYQSTNGDIYDVTSFGLFRSANGVNFQKVLDVNVHCFKQTKNGCFYAGSCAKGLFYSKNGQNWTAVAHVSGASVIIGIDQMPNGDIYIQSEHNGLFLKKANQQNFSLFSKLNTEKVVANPVGGVLVWGALYHVYNIFNYKISPSLSHSLVTGLSTTKSGFYTTELNPQTEQKTAFYWQ